MRKIIQSLGKNRKKYVFKGENIEVDLLGQGDRHGKYPIIKQLLPDCPLVISTGIGDDVEAEIDLINKYDALVIAFDPNIVSVKYVAENVHSNNFEFIPVAIAKYNGQMTMYDTANPNYASWISKPEHVNWCKVSDKKYIVECKTIKTIMQEKGLNNIDYLKLNVEGSCYDVIEEILEDKLNITQIAVCIPGRGDRYNYKYDKKMYKSLISAGYRCVKGNDDSHYLFFK